LLQKQILLSPTARRAISELSATLDISPLKSALERLGRRKAPLSDHHD